MDITQLIGFLAAGFVTCANIPQAYVIIRDKSTGNISVTTYCLLLAGTLLWVAYGIIRTDWPIIVANGISAITSAVILSLNFASSHTIGKIHQSVMPESLKKKGKSKK